jgi:peptidoglycan/xylan/chitin deacetylase (PgdA/CDA1 family)
MNVANLLPGTASRVFSSSIWRIENENNSVFLTFDDGPVPEVTPKILKILKEYNAKATFFCVGNNVEKYNDIYKQIIYEGHNTGNHTYNHINGWKVSTNKYIDDVYKTSEILKSQLFRPPHGKLRLKQYYILKKNFKIIMWSILTGDYEPEFSVNECFNNLIYKTQPGDIIVFHDSVKAKKNVLNILPKTLEYYISKNYKFETL